MSLKEINEILHDLGFSIGHAIAGGIGSVVSIANSDKPLSRPKRILSFLSGLGCANYFGPLVSDFFRVGDDYRFLGGFLIGFGGMKFVESVFIFASEKFLGKRKEKDTE